MPRIRPYLALALVAAILLASGASFALERPATRSLPVPSTLDQYGGDAGLKLTAAPGYFRTAQQGDRWWLVTPRGHAFYSLGVNSISTTFGLDTADGYASYASRSYADPQAWAQTTAARLQSWHFNTVGAWSDQRMEQRGLPHTRLLKLVGDTPSRVNWVFPDVFDPAWERHIRQQVAAKISAADVQDPWLLGYYLDNELWWYKDGVYYDTPHNTVVENIIAQPITNSSKLAWVSHLAGRYGTVAGLNAAWGSSYASFRDGPASLLAAQSITYTGSLPDKDSFLKVVSDRYFKTTSAAVRARDPNHLILGCRWLPSQPFRSIIEGAIPYVDVMTINLYVRDFSNPDLSFVDEIGAWSGKPVLITEFTARAADSGLPNAFPAPGAVAPDQRTRAAAYRTFIAAALQRPFVVGVHWFPYADDPAIGKRPEQSNNWGLVTASDQPYADFVQQVSSVNQGVYQLRRGREERIGVPQPLAPAYNATLFSADLRRDAPHPAAWQPLAGASRYVVQVAQTPDFAQPVAITTTASQLASLPLSNYEGGRGYWRVRAVGKDDQRSDEEAYSVPQPFYLRQTTGSSAVTGIWQADPPASVMVSGTLQFSGATGSVAGYSWAFVQRTATITDWSGYDYLLLTVTDPRSSGRQAQLRVNIAEAGGNSYNWQATLLQGRATQLVLPLKEATTRLERHVDLRQIASLRVGLLLPEVGQQLSVGEPLLIRVERRLAAQPPVSPLASDAAISGTIQLDWHSYRPAPSTVAYRIYASQQQITNTASLSPVVELDAVAQQTRVKLLAWHSGKSPQPLLNGNSYYFAVVPVDSFGNEGVVGAAASAVPGAASLRAQSP